MKCLSPSRFRLLSLTQRRFLSARPSGSGLNNDNNTTGGGFEEFINEDDINDDQTNMYREKENKYNNIMGWQKRNRNRNYFNENDTNSDHTSRDSTHSFESKVWSWGWGNHGALGHGNYNDILIPRVVESLTNMNIINISAGWAHSMALTSDGKVYRWGWADDIKTIYSCANLKVNAPGLLTSVQEIGHTTRLGWLLFDNATLYPTYVHELSDIFIDKIVCGAATSFCLSTDGKVYSWGTGRWGQLGHQICNHWTEEFIRPTVIERLLGHNIINIDTGYVHTLFLDSTNCLWVCGPGLNGRLGLGMGSRLGEFPIPRPLTPLWKQHFRQQWHKKEKEKLMMIDVNNSKNDIIYSKRLLEENNSNNDNDSIDENNESNMIDNNNNNENDKNKKEYKLIGYSSGFEADEDAYGDNINQSSINSSLLHEFDYNYYHINFGIEPPYSPKIIKMSCGHKHSCILTEDGKVWTFGAGNTGALGIKQDYRDKHWPTLVHDLVELNEFVIDIDCGQNHTVALTQNNNIYTWGMSRHGQCGRPRHEAFMLEDVRERGSNLTTLSHRPPFPLNDSINHININNNNNENNNNENKNNNNDNIYENYMYKDQDDGILLRGDPLAMPVGKIMNIPKKYKIYKIVAGFYETSIITECGTLITYGANAERLENEPKPKIIKLPEKIVDVTHGWRHTMALTIPYDQ